MDEINLPEDLSNYIEETIDEYTEKLKTIEENFDLAVRAQLRSITQSTQDARREYDRVLETRKKMEQDIQIVKESIASYEQKLAQAKEGGSLARQVSEQEDELERVKQSNDALEERRDELLLRLQQKRANINDKQFNVMKMKQLCTIDLDACKKSTQLKILTTGVENYIEFVFKCIKRNHPDEPHSFQLYIDENHHYSVSHCSPSLREMDSLVDILNNDRNIYTFVKRVRKAFEDQVNA